MSCRAFVAAIASSPSELSETAIEQGAGLMASMVSGEEELDDALEAYREERTVSQEVESSFWRRSGAHPAGPGHGRRAWEGI